MPLAFLLLQSFFERFPLLFDSFVLLDKPINLCLELFDMIQSHAVAPKISGLSLVLSSCLVKPRFRRSRVLKSHQSANDRRPAALITDRAVTDLTKARGKREFYWFPRQISVHVESIETEGPRFFPQDFYGCFGSAGSS